MAGILVTPELVLAVVRGTNEWCAVAGFVVELILVLELDTSFLAYMLLFVWLCVVVIVGSSMGTL